MPINVKLLREVQELIQKEPRKIKMEVLLTSEAYELCKIDEKDKPPCGTVGCIAGWSYALTVGNDEWQKAAANPNAQRQLWQKATVLLGLSDDESDRLFSDPIGSLSDADDEEGYYNPESSWPFDLAEAYQAATTPIERASVVSERIDRFIASGGAE